MIPDSVKERILDADIKRVIEAEGIALQRSGGDYVCCCPFHKEKTPSFHIHSARNSYKCFGCGKGGDSIQFVMELKGMTFHEAVEYLAAELKIPYDREEETPAQRERRQKADQLISVNKAAMAWFRERLDEIPAARKYVKERGWSDEVMDAFGVGFAPQNGGLVKAMTAKGWSERLLLEAGVAKRNEDDGSVYDAFRDRVMFPLYSKSGFIAGFTGRYIGDKPNVPKYLNTAETPLFKKGEILFGWQQSRAEIRNRNTAVFVEGNPDVLRLHQIGQPNAVAPCGTALTEDQVSLIQSKADNVIIIGDTDEAGRKAVKKNARMFLEAGMMVRVMDLPELSGESKTDADSFFLRREDGWNAMMSDYTTDYVPWYCEALMKDVTSQTRKAEVITEVCGLVAAVKDEKVAELYIETFTKEYKSGKIWRQEYQRLRNERERKAAKDEGSEDMVRRYGFYIKRNCYYGAGLSGAEIRWSNFVIRPILHVRDERNAKRIMELTNEDGQTSVVKFSQSELVSFTDFKTRCESAGNYIWEKTMLELTKVKAQLYTDTPSADEIRQLGWQKKFGFYAWGNGGYERGEFRAVDKYGILDIKGGKYYLPGSALDTQANTGGYQLVRKFVHVEPPKGGGEGRVTLREFVTKLVGVFGDNAKIAFCFLIATLFKDAVTAVTTSFPILNLFGPKGTGKSELGHALTAFFGVGHIAPNISNTTKAALAEAVAEVSNAVVHLDEYKNDIDLDKREFLKGLWDGTGRSRMNMENDKRRETTAVDCGVVMSGQEMPTADIALFNRLVFLTFNNTTFDTDAKRRFEELVKLEKRGLTHLTCEILGLRDQFTRKFRYAWDETASDMTREFRGETVEDRTFRNWVTIVAAFRCVADDIDAPFTYQETLALAARMCLRQNNMTQKNNELSGFWDAIASLVGSSKMWIEADYKIMSGKRTVKIKESTAELEIRPDKKYLYLSFQRIATLYSKECREGSTKGIPAATLKYYLEHSPEFLGTVRAMRFRLIMNSQGFMPEGPGERKERTTTAMMFDYEKLCRKYDIDLEVVGSGGGYESGGEDGGMFAPALPGMGDGWEGGEETNELPF